MNQAGKGVQRRIIYTAGTWDVFHYGHLRMIQRVREMADVLIVGVSTDQLVSRYKGHTPIDPFPIRYQTICELGIADVVIPQIQQFHLDRMEKLHVTEVVMGSDWSKKTTDALERLKDRISVVFLTRTESVSSSDIRRTVCGGDK